MKINDYCNHAGKWKDLLIDIYGMKDWGVSLSYFVQEALIELNELSKTWIFGDEEEED